MTSRDLHLRAEAALGFARAWLLGMTLIGALDARPVPAASLPVGVADHYSVREDQTLDVASPGVLVNDTDADGDPLTGVLVMEPDHGMVSFNSDGSFSYTPNWNFHGADSFIYQAQDATTHSSPVAVTVTVLSVNDVPVARANKYSLGKNTALMIPAPGVLGNDLDLDGDPLSAVRVGLPSHGTLTLKADGAFTYRPDTNFVGTDSFTYIARDATTNSRPATVTLTVMQDELQTRLASAIPSRMDRIVKLEDGRMMIEFTGLAGQTYAIQYSNDLMTWWTATPLHEATASRAQWIDNDPPKTLNDSPTNQGRFYRLFRLPIP